MNIQDGKTPLGSLRISREVLGTIVAHAACEVPGVVGIATIGDNIRGMISQKKLVKPVDVVLVEGTANIDIQVILEYGAKIPVISAKIQEAVKEVMQSMTGIPVSKVNITIAGIAPGLNQE